MPRLTDEFVSNKKEPGEYRDERTQGFLLRVRPSGIKSYEVHARLKGGDMVRYVIGKHGDWTPRTARDEAEKIRQLMRRGIDPRAEIAKQKSEHQAYEAAKQREVVLKDLTLRTIFEAWCKDTKPKDNIQNKNSKRKKAKRKLDTKKSTKTLYGWVISKHLQDWLDISISAITPEMVVERYDLICAHTVSSANNSFRALRRLFNWAIVKYKDDQGKSLLDGNPVKVLSDQERWYEIDPRDDRIEDDDLPAWFDAVHALSNQIWKDYFLFLALTGLRRDEAKTIKFSTGVNLKGREIIISNTKNGREHKLPLTDHLQELLERRSKYSKDIQADSKQKDYVFPGTSKAGHIADVRFYQNKIIEKSKVQFTPHSLRRTFAHAAARVRLGESERKRLLNHIDKSNVTERHYTPWQAKELRDSLKMVQDFILEKSRKAQDPIDNLVLMPSAG